MFSELGIQLEQNIKMEQIHFYKIYSYLFSDLQKTKTKKKKNLHILVIIYNDKKKKRKNLNYKILVH